MSRSCAAGSDNGVPRASTPIENGTVTGRHTGTSLARVQEQSHRKDPYGRSCRGALGFVAGMVKRRYPLPGATLRESWWRRQSPWPCASRRLRRARSPLSVEGAVGLFLDRRGCHCAARGLRTDRSLVVRSAGGGIAVTSRCRTGVILPPETLRHHRNARRFDRAPLPTQSLSSPRGGHSHAEESKDTCGDQPGREAP